MGTGEPAPEPSCSVCRDSGLYSGYVERPDNTRELWLNRPCPSKGCRASAEAGARQQQERLDALFDQARVPQRFADATLATVEQPAEIVERSLAAVTSGRSVLLVGGYGTGKTWLAVALLRERMAANVAGVFAEVPDLLARIRRSYGEGGNAADDLVEAAATAPILCLDDLGAEKSSPWVQETLFRIVNQRYCDCRPTIVTSNVRLYPPASDPKADSLAARVGYRVVSRLADGAEYIRFEGADRRVRR